MSTSLLKYNPGLVSDEELIRSFVVRLRDFEWLLDIVAANSSLQANQHVLVVGPRGAGKTTLVRRVELEIKTRPDLNQSWHPIMFSEETYSVGSPGEFWLEALSQIYNDSGDSRWKKIHDELAKGNDDANLRDSALGQVLDYADQLGKKLILIVENLNMLLGQLQTNSDWDLRHTLLNESRIMLLGTATNRFSELENVDRAWFELFTTHELKPLNTKDSLALWKSYTGMSAPLRRVQALRILTGGNPRLFRILSDFAIKASLRELMDNLTRLIDEHTEYFKGSLESLAPLERKVFVALLERWDPSDAREIAIAARLDVSKTSALLGRLVEKGRVATVSSLGRRRKYQAAERLFNIYYLMRRHGRPADRVRAVVRFMVQFYRDDSLVSTVTGIAREACFLEPNQRQDHYSAYAGVLACGLGHQLSSKILKQTPRTFFQGSHAPREVRLLGGIVSLPSTMLTAEVEALLQTAATASPDDPELRMLLERVVHQRANISQPNLAYESDRSHSDEAWLWVWLAEKLHDLGLFDEAFTATENGVGADPANAAAWHWRGELLWFHLRRDDEEEAVGSEELEASKEKQAEASFRKAIELDSTIPLSHGMLSTVLRCQGNLEGAEEEIQKALALDQDSAPIWSELGAVKLRLHKFREAEDALRRALKLDKDNPFSWGELGLLLAHDDGRTSEAIDAYQHALRLKQTDLFAWSKLMRLRARTGTSEELLSLVQEFLYKQKHSQKATVLAAWTIHDAEKSELLPYAIGLVRTSFAEAPDNWKLSHTLASLLAKNGNWKEAFDAISSAVKACAKSEQALKHVTDFFISAAANGYAREATAILDLQGEAAVLEPLRVGVRLFLGEQPSVAQEVLDVGEDVAKQIRELRAKLHPEPKQMRVH